MKVNPYNWCSHYRRANLWQAFTTECNTSCSAFTNIQVYGENEYNQVQNLVTCYFHSFWRVHCNDIFSGLQTPRAIERHLKHPIVGRHAAHDVEVLHMGAVLANNAYPLPFCVEVVEEREVCCFFVRLARRGNLMTVISVDCDCLSLHEVIRTPLGKKCGRRFLRCPANPVKSEERKSVKMDHLKLKGYWVRV